MIDELTYHQPEVIKIGNISLFCEKMRITAAAVVYEKSTVNGENLVTGKFSRSSKITLAGRMPSDDSSIAIVRRLNNMTGSGIHSVSYRGLTFPECIILGFSAEDSGDFIALTITLSAPYPAEYEEE